MKKSLLLVLIISLIFLSGINRKEAGYTETWDANSKVSLVLEKLGEPLPKHYPPTFTATLAQQGEELVKYGKTSLPGETSSKFISKFYTCTSCHNIRREDPDLRHSDPEKRLTYAREHNMPFLQGTTFFGMVNRETWYNDDYLTKYGDLAKIAHDSLRESIQLCAEVCSQGRRLENWELEAILCYVWTLEYSLGDLGLTQKDYDRLNNARNEEEKHRETILWLKTFYAQKSPATFTDAPSDKQKGYGMQGNPSSGKDIYELSCQNCHHPNGESNLVLDNDVVTFRKFRRNIAKENRFSLYKIIRYGTHPVIGHRPYMPHYTLERMSHRQVEDLRAYIEQQANQ